MNKSIFLLYIIFLSSCSTNTMITGSWKSPSATSVKYESILVASLTNNTVMKSTLENNLTEQLSQHEMTALKGIELFPPEISKSDSDKSSIMQKVRGRKIGAILTVSVLKKATESRYLHSRFAYDPMSRYDYYGDFWGYYSYWYPYSYNPAYYSERVYYLETNLYDAKTEKLMWSAQSKTYDVQTLDSFSKDFSKTIVERLTEEKIIPPKAK